MLVISVSAPTAAALNGAQFFAILRLLRRDANLACTQPGGASCFLYAHATLNLLFSLFDQI